MKSRIRFSTWSILVFLTVFAVYLSWWKPTETWGLRQAEVILMDSIV
jgi:hypothetical protein